MCAGKLLSLIKKCLHREKAGQKCDCNGNASTTTTATGKSPGEKYSSSSSCSSAPVSKKKSSPGTGPGVPGCCLCQQQCAHNAGLTSYHQQHVGAMSHMTTTSTTLQTQTTTSTAPGMVTSGYCRLCHVCSTGTHGGLDHSQAHGHIGTHCCTMPCTSPVVYVPSTPMDRVDREVALQRERQQRRQAIQTDMELNLPPAISISEDGEEGYAQSQRLLQLSCQQRPGESIRPPPNKTVLPGDSPPPYRSNSVSKLEGHYYHKRGGGGHPQSFPPAACVGSRHVHQHQQACGGSSSSSSPFIPRCHSISSSGDKRLPQMYSGHQARHSIMPTCGHTSTASPPAMTNPRCANT